MTKLWQFSKRQKFFLIIVMSVCGLLIYANGIAFNLFSAPSFFNDIIAYAALAVAVTFTIVFMAIVLRDMRNGVFSKTQKSPVIGAVLESEGAPGNVPLAVIAEENMNEIKPNPEFLQGVIAQKSPKKTGVEFSEQDQPVKQLIIERTKLICPACRREFELPNFLGDLIVDFGPPKPTNLIRRCRYCAAPIALKQRVAAEREVWKE